MKILLEKQRKLEESKDLEILIIEDDIIISRMHKFSLSGYVSSTPQICSNGKEAIDRLDEIAEEREKILILLDLNMPVMNGWEFLEECHARPYSDKLFVVVVTSSSFIDDKQKALEYERVKAFYSKPMKKEYLCEIFQEPEIVRSTSLKSQ